MKLTHAVTVPVGSDPGSTGVLIAAFSTPPRDAVVTLWTAQACAAVLALGAHRPDVLHSLLQAPRLDGLTGCLNYSDTRLELEREINRSTRGDLNLSLCFIDLDHFKRVNDQHGHLRGNDVLREVAHVLRESVRSCDTVGRFGGDEFIAILPDTGEPAAAQLAARLRSSVTAAAITAVGGALTASVGAATWTPGMTADALLSRADEALLAAKRERRLRAPGRGI